MSWRRIWLWALGAFLVTRLAYLLITVAVGVANGRHDLGSLFESWDQWDTGWYLGISRRGYFSPASTVFLPLYPGLTGALAALLGDAHGAIWPAPDHLRLGIALAVANAGALAAIAGVVALGTQEADEATGRRAARLFLAYPFAFFLAAAYTEGPFVAFATWSLVCARRGQWLPAAALAFLAGLTRITGVILILPLLWELGLQRGWWDRRLPLVAGAVPAAVALYAAYLYATFRDPLLFLSQQSVAWHRQQVFFAIVPIRAAARIVRLPLGDETRWVQTAELTAILLFAALMLLAIRQLPLSFTLFMAGLLYLSVASPIVTGPYFLQSAGRFLVAAVPVFYMAARWMAGRRAVELAVLSAGSLLQGLFVAMFLTGHVIE